MAKSSPELKLAINGIRWAVISILIAVALATIDISLNLIGLENIKPLMTFFVLAIYFWLMLKLVKILKEIDQKYSDISSSHK